MRTFFIHKRSDFSYFVFNTENWNRGTIALDIKGDRIVYSDFHPNGVLGTVKGLGSNAELAVLEDIIKSAGDNLFIAPGDPTVARVNHLRKFKAKAGSWLSLIPGIHLYEDVVSYQEKLTTYVNQHKNRIEMIWTDKTGDKYISKLYEVMAERQARIERWVANRSLI